MPCQNIKKNTPEIMDNIISLNTSHYELLSRYNERQLLHFITFTLQPKSTLTKGGSKMNAKMQFKKTYQTAKDTLNFYTKSFVMVAELTKKGIIHYHAIAELNDNHQLAQAQITDSILQSKILGFHEIEPIKKLQDVKNYLFKDYLITMQIINKTTNHEDDIIDICLYRDNIKPTTPKETSFLDRIITTYDNSECNETSRFILDFD